jgi:hypothetical protein
MAIRRQRLLANTACLGVLAGALAVGAVAAAPLSTAQTCGPGFVPNPYNAQCLAPVTTPVINGIPCVPSKLGLCSSFVQNQQPPRVPRTSAS